MTPATRRTSSPAPGNSNVAAAAGGPAVRRAPFSSNPTVGPRGQRTQQRILDAALRVLREHGYHRCSIDHVARQAGCSRVSFYQYFSSKEDAYYHLAAQVARQVSASVEALELLTDDALGWASISAWITRESETYQRYGAVFNAFTAAAAGTPAVASLGASAAEDNVARIRARLAVVNLPAREVDAVISLLLGCLARTFHLASVLRAAAPEAYPAERIERALTDVVHRTFFGLAPDVNVHDAVGPQPPRLAFPAATRGLLAGRSAGDPPASPNPTVDTLLAAARDAFVARGYHGTRVDDIAAAAGLSHGVFYRYFKNKSEIAHALVVDAMRPLGRAFADMPSAACGDRAAAPALRRWLRRYNASHVHEAAMIRVWVDAGLQDAALGGDAAPAVDWGRRRVAEFLRPRGFGDIDAEAVVMVALLDAFGGQPRSSRTIDAVAHIIFRGLLGVNG